MNPMLVLTDYESTRIALVRPEMVIAAVPLPARQTSEGHEAPERARVLFVGGSAVVRETTREIQERMEHFGRLDALATRRAKT